MPPLLLFLCGNLHLLVVQLEVLLHLLDGSVRDVETEFLFGDGE